MLCVSLRCFGYFLRPLYLTATCSEFASGVPDYGFFWGDDVLVYFRIQLLLGSTLDTCLRQYMEAYGSDCRKLRSLRSCSSLLVVDIPFVPQRQTSMVQTILQPMEFLQLQFVFGLSTSLLCGRADSHVQSCRRSGPDPAEGSAVEGEGGGVGQQADEEKEKEEEEETSSRSLLSWLRSSSMTVARFWLVFWFRAVFPSIVGRPERPGLTFGVDSCGFAGYDAPRVLFPSGVAWPGRQYSSCFVVNRCSGLCKVGFSGDYAPRTMFPSVVAWPKTLGILAGMDQKNSYVVLSCHGAEAVSHGPDCSADPCDSAVTVLCEVVDVLRFHRCSSWTKLLYVLQGLMRQSTGAFESISCVST